LLKNRIFPIALALALALYAATVAPRTTLARHASHASSSGTETSRADGARTRGVPATDSSDEAASEQQSKRKGNGFARALGAPFRALARLFGGKKSTSEEAGRRKASSRQTADAAAQTSPASEAPKQGVEPTAASNVAAQSTQQVTPAPVMPAALKVDKSKLKTTARAVVMTEPLTGASAPEVESLSSTPPPAAVATTRTEEGARVVRPDETGAIVEPPKMWIPIIDGISKDSLTQGRALLEHGYVQEAVAELTIAATQVGPGLVEANNLLGIAYDRLGWHKQAADAYDRALTVAPKDPNVIANLGYSLYLADDYAGALKRLKQAAKLAPGQPVIYNNLGIVLASTSRYEEAYKYFAIASNEYDAHLKLASILEEHHRDRDAVKHYEAALAMQPGASAILERLVALYERTGERDKADTARRALGQPKNPQKTTTGGGG
jgi:Tfp pilus assembly protein PilF